MMRQLDWALTGVVAVAFFMTGCSKPEAGKETAEATKTAGGHEHGEWWCDEHGVPEEICAQCDKDIAADFKAKGDWCKEHDRPDSQCFICHPELEAKFAAQYQAKYGKQPPKPKAEGDDHDHDDHDHDHKEKS